MPTISFFYGILIQMYWNEHNPPHFHAKYGEYEALIGINDFSLIRGKLPPKALALVVEWASIHQKELLLNWELGKQEDTFKKIEPLN
jgi:hypothetical protein